MSVQTEKDMLCINQIIGQKSQTIMVETDCVVPDIKPDILNTVNMEKNNLFHVLIDFKLIII